MEKENDKDYSKNEIHKYEGTVRQIYRELFEKLGAGFFSPFFNTYNAKQQLLCPVSSLYWVRDGLSIGAIARLFPFPFFSQSLDIVADNKNISYGSLGENIILLGRPVEELFKSEGIKKVINKIRKVQMIKTPDNVNDKKITVQGINYSPEEDKKSKIPLKDYGVVGRYIFLDKILINIYGCRSLGTYGASLFISYHNNLIQIARILSKLNSFKGEISENLEILVKVTMEEGNVQTPGIELKRIFYGNQHYDVQEQRWISQVWQYDHVYACVTKLNKDLSKEIIKNTNTRRFYFNSTVNNIDFKLAGKKIAVKINKNNWKTIQPKEAALLIIMINLTEGHSGKDNKVTIESIRSEAESGEFNVKQLDKDKVLLFWKENRLF